MYICDIPLPVILCDDAAPTGRNVYVKSGSKWRREDNQKHGLSTVHLINLSGKVNEEISWLEIDEKTLEKHFQKIITDS